MISMQFFNNNMPFLKSKSLKVIQQPKQVSFQRTSVVQNFQEIHPQILRVDLRHTLVKFIMIPLKIQAIYWLYFIHCIISVCQILARIPYDLLFWLYNIFANIFGLTQTKTTSLFAWIIIIGSLIVTRDINFLDLSVLYHSFRGQSTVKLYGAALALQISQKLLTLAGRFLLQKLQLILISNKTKVMYLIPELFLCLIYTLFHFFSLYLDFILFMIVINSSNHSMLMFFFVTNLGKMKAATFKKFQKKSFRNSIVFDAKDRLHKITYAILFLITNSDRVGPQAATLVFSVIAYCSLIDYLRHLANLSMAGKHSQIGDLQQNILISLFSQRFDYRYRYSIATSLQWDFTVLPYVLLIIKFVSIASHGDFFLLQRVIWSGYLSVLVASMIANRIVLYIIQRWFLNPLHESRT